MKSDWFPFGRNNLGRIQYVWSAVDGSFCDADFNQINCSINSSFPQHWPIRGITASSLIDTIGYVTSDEVILADVSAFLQLQWNILLCPATLQRQIRKWLYATHNHAHQSFLFFAYGLLFTRKIQLFFTVIHTVLPMSYTCIPCHAHVSLYTLRTSGRGEWELRRAYCL